MEKYQQHQSQQDRKRTEDHNTQKKGGRMPPNEMATQPTASTKISFIFLSNSTTMMTTTTTTKTKNNQFFIVPRRRTSVFINKKTAHKTEHQINDIVITAMEKRVHIEHSRHMAKIDLSHTLFFVVAFFSTSSQLNCEYRIRHPFYLSVSILITHCSRCARIIT